MSFYNNQKIECYDECYVRCIYQPSELGVENPQFWPSKNEIAHELRSHNHPINRRLNNQNRTLEEAVLELVQHYKFSHNIWFSDQQK